ncbi:MAG TPA: cyclase family protein [Acidimicrobiales bacterium]|nr:cyclase family protein [Acidimicrobiales bacterium]
MLSAEFLELAARVSNWGRWGDDDELGTVNLIDDAAVRRGAACVRTGVRFSLAVRMDQQSPQIGSIPGRVNPLRTMVAINTPYMGTPDEFCASDDVVTMGLQAATHWDALAHVSYGGKLYNGFPASSTTAEAGATRCGISRVTSITTRGVLLDVARARGVDRLEPGYGITSDDLDAALSKTEVSLEPGDVALVRTGHLQLFKARQRETYTGGHQPGLTMRTAAWFHDHDLAGVATDTVAFEVYPCEDPQVLFPVHLLHLRDMGMLQGQNFDLEALAESCAADGVYEFLLEASPLPFTGGCGSPVNPVAVK